MNNYLERFLNRQANKNTKRAYERTIIQMLDYVNKNEQDIKYIDIDDWRSYVKNTYSSATSKNKIAIVKSYFLYLYNLEIIKDLRLTQIESVQAKSKIKVPLTEDEIESLIMHSKCIRDQAIIVFLANTGLRVSELCQLKLSDIRDNRITIVGKGDKTRYVFMNDKVQDFLNQYLEIRPETEIDNVFISNQNSPIDRVCVNRTIKTIAKRANIEHENGISAHLFRATYASSLSKKGVPIAVIQKVLGHSDIKTTMIYVKTDEEQVAQAMMN